MWGDAHVTTRRLSVVMLLSLSLVSGCGDKDPANQPAAKLLIAAHEALSRGDEAAAMEALSASLEANPTGWAYFQRAKLKLAQGDDAAAIADCQAGLELEPENVDLKWLMGEAKKPQQNRFKGANAKPPSAAK